MNIPRGIWVHIEFACRAKVWAASWWFLSGQEGGKKLICAVVVGCGSFHVISSSLHSKK